MVESRRKKTTEKEGISSNTEWPNDFRRNGNSSRRTTETFDECRTCETRHDRDSFSTPMEEGSLVVDDSEEVKRVDNL